MSALGSDQSTRRQAADYGGEVGWELAQVNVGRMRSSLDTPEMAAFVAAIDPVLRMAEESDGFVWRYADGHGRTVTVRADGVDTMVVNLSVWTSYEAATADFDVPGCAGPGVDDGDFVGFVVGGEGVAPVRRHRDRVRARWDVPLCRDAQGASVDDLNAVPVVARHPDPVVGSHRESERHGLGRERADDLQVLRVDHGYGAPGMVLLIR
jgi:hypothetical protein